MCGEKVKINPEEGVFLGCGSSKSVDPSNILDDLEANIVILWGEDRVSKVALISIDSLFLGRELELNICSKLSDLFSPEEIFLAATHAHTAPMIDETKPRLGRKNYKYATMLVERIVQGVRRAVADTPQAVTLRKYKSKLGGVVQRRNNRLFELSRFGLKWKPTLQRPNLRKGATGTDATFAEFLNEKDQVLAVVAIVSCHPVALMGKELISADYVAGLRSEFRQQICVNQETPFVFLQGASGDLNPWWKPRWLDEGPVKFFDQIVNGVRFSEPAFSVSDLGVWCKARVSELVSDRDRHLRGASGVSQRQNVNSVLHRIPLANFLKKAQGLEYREVCFHQLDIGDLKILGVSAEITSKLEQELRPLIGDVALVGCIRDTFGYATSSRQYVEGGYEVEGHQWHFSISHLDLRPPGRLIERAIEQFSNIT
jgi:hypothetical protein